MSNLNNSSQVENNTVHRKNSSNTSRPKIKRSISDDSSAKSINNLNTSNINSLLQKRQPKQFVASRHSRTFSLGKNISRLGKQNALGYSSIDLTSNNSNASIISKSYSSINSQMNQNNSNSTENANSNSNSNSNTLNISTSNENLKQPKSPAKQDKSSKRPPLPPSLTQSSRARFQKSRSTDNFGLHRILTESRLAARGSHTKPVPSLELKPSRTKKQRKKAIMDLQIQNDEQLIDKQFDKDIGTTLNQNIDRNIIYQSPTAYLYEFENHKQNPTNDMENNENNTNINKNQIDNENSANVNENHNEQNNVNKNEIHVDNENQVTNQNILSINENHSGNKNDINNDINISKNNVNKNTDEKFMHENNKTLLKENEFDSGNQSNIKKQIESNKVIENSKTKVSQTLNDKIISTNNLHSPLNNLVIPQNDKDVQTKISKNSSNKDNIDKVKPDGSQSIDIQKDKSTSILNIPVGNSTQKFSPASPAPAPPQLCNDRVIIHNDFDNHSGFTTSKATTTNALTNNNNNPSNSIHSNDSQNKQDVNSLQKGKLNEESQGYFKKSNNYSSSTLFSDLENSTNIKDNSSTTNSYSEKSPTKIKQDSSSILRHEYVTSVTSSALPVHTRTQQKLWLQRASINDAAHSTPGLNDKSSANIAGLTRVQQSTFLNAKLIREIEHASKDYENIRRFSNPLKIALTRLELNHLIDFNNNENDTSLSNQYQSNSSSSDVSAHHSHSASLSGVRSSPVKRPNIERSYSSKDSVSNKPQNGDSVTLQSGITKDSGGKSNRIPVSFTVTNLCELVEQSSLEKNKRASTISLPHSASDDTKTNLNNQKTPIVASITANESEMQNSLEDKKNEQKKKILAKMWSEGWKKESEMNKSNDYSDNQQQQSDPQQQKSFHGHSLSHHPHSRSHMNVHSSHSHLHNFHNSSITSSIANSKVTLNSPVSQGTMESLHSARIQQQLRLQQMQQQEAPSNIAQTNNKGSTLNNVSQNSKINLNETHKINESNLHQNANDVGPTYPSAVRSAMTSRSTNKQVRPNDQKQNSQVKV